MNDPSKTSHSGDKRPSDARSGRRRKGAAPSSQTPKKIGPVSDLERHLPSDWWRTLFNSLYLKTDGDVVENRAATSLEVDRLVAAAGLKHDDAILDLCCGQGRHCLELARRGFRKLIGVDRSRYLVRLARKRARQENLAVKFHEGDARKFRTAEGTVDCVTLLGNSFGYFDREEDDLAVLRSAMKALRPGGTVVLDVADGEWLRANFDRRSWEWIDQDHFVCRERCLSADEARVITREVVVHSERGVIADQFYAERLYSEADLRACMNEAGFFGTCVHDGIATQSTREQDLGMLARRILLTAVAPERPAPPSVRGPLFRHVTVILGDPRRPDLVKREGHFNEEDFETVDRLKRALAELEDYEFRFLDDHDRLAETLRGDRPEFVLNLCDEGYNNNAFMELHVPALLEMLGVPYTGAAPCCLGLCFNKALVRAIASTLDVPVPAETYFDQTDQAATLPSSFPALVKPNFGDSSVGITVQSVVHSPEDVVAYLRSLHGTCPDQPVLIQEFLPGAEYSVGIVGNPGMGARVLPVLEVDYSGLDPGLPQILGYESKWIPDSPYWKQIRYQEANLDDETERTLADYSILLFERLACRDYARFDFRRNASGEIKLLEVNPNPGWCWDGKLNFMAEYAGLTYAQLLRLILTAAQDRVGAARRVGAPSVPAGVS